MEPLYTTQSNWSYEEFKKYSLYLSYHRPAQIIIAVILGLETVFLMAVAVLLICLDEPFEGIMFLICIVFLDAIYLLLPRYRIRRTYKSHKLLQKNSPFTMNLFDDNIESKSLDGATKLKYEDIYKIYETKTNFYIMLSVNQGMNIIKANCSAGLIEHLHQLRETIKK